MNVVWRKQAAGDLHRILEYIASRNPAAADRIEELASQCAERLASHPYMYRRGRAPGTREAVLHPNYILVYEVGLEAVEIVAMVHARQNYP